jgi:hypothetical protein
MAIGMYYVPIAGASPVAGGNKSLQNPITWAEAALRGLDFNMTIAPQGFQNQILGLKTLRGSNGGSGCTSASATVSGAVGFAATATISNGTVGAWTVTAPHTSGVASVTYNAVSITYAGCATAPLATPVVGGIGTFGISGQNSLEIRERVSDICNGVYGIKPNIVVVEGVYNDLALTGALNGWTGDTQSLTGSVLVARMMNIVNDLSSCGILPVVIAEAPKVLANIQSLGGYDATQAAIVMKTTYAFNSGMKTAANKAATAKIGQGFFLFVDGFIPYVVNNASTNGDASLYMTQDGLHPAQWEAAQQGYFLAKALQPYVAPLSFNSPISAIDAYDATYNVTGAINPVWQGTGATAAGLMTGALAPSWNNSASTSGTLPANGSITTTLTKPGPTTRDSDGLMTPSWTEVFAIGAVAATGSSNTITITSSFSASLPSGVVAGDYLDFACDIEYSSLNNVYSFSAELEDNTNVMLYNAGGNGSSYMPASNDPLVGSAGVTGWFGWPLRFHSAPLKVLSNTLSGTVRTQFLANVDASTTPNSIAGFGAVAGVSGTVRYRNCTEQEYGKAVN